MSSLWADNLRSLSAVLLTLTTLTITLRFYARKKMAVPLWADDYIMLLAYLSFVAITAGMFVWTSSPTFASFSPDSPPPPNAYSSPSTLLAVLTLLSVLCLGCTKSSACLLYRRIFDVRVYDRRSVVGLLINITVGIIACWTLVFLILFGLSCDGHLPELLNPQTHIRSCGKAWTNLLAIGITDVVLDVWVLALPMIPVFRLHANLGKKMSIAGIFALGGGALGASIARLVISTEFLKMGTGEFSARGVQGELSKCFFYLTFESGISIVAINLPIIGPLIMHSDYRFLKKAGKSVRSLFSTEGGSEKLGSGRNAGERLVGAGSQGSDGSGRKKSGSSGGSEMYDLHRARNSEGDWDGTVDDTDGGHVRRKVEVWSKQNKPRGEGNLRSTTEDFGSRNPSSELVA